MAASQSQLQFQLRKHTYLLTFKIGMSLFCLFFILLFCLLGAWQLQRFHFKKALLKSYQEQRYANPIPFSSAMNSQNIKPFQMVSVKGHYLNDSTVFIQNRPYKGQIGFEVLTPLQINGEQTLLLVDRGWVNKEKIAPVKEVQHIKGYIKLLNEHQFILGKNILNPNAKPVMMQKIDIDEISRIRHQLFYPFILRLDASEANGFVRDWIISASPPERHMGYAIQWFTMAIVLLIAFFCFSCERKKC